jgi:hypothetical protein
VRHAAIFVVHPHCVILGKSEEEDFKRDCRSIDTFGKRLIRMNVAYVNIRGPLFTQN